MHRATIRPLGRLALAGALLLALLTPAAVFAADPVPSASASAEASQPTDAGASPSASQVISVDPTFIIAPTASPRGAVLSATGRPERTLPPTDAEGGTKSTGTNAQGLLLVLLALVTICLVVAPLPEVRRR